MASPCPPLTVHLLVGTVGGLVRGTQELSHSSGGRGRGGRAGRSCDPAFGLVSAHPLPLVSLLLSAWLFSGCWARMPPYGPCLPYISLLGTPHSSLPSAFSSLGHGECGGRPRSLQQGHLEWGKGEGVGFLEAGVHVCGAPWTFVSPARKVQWLGQPRQVLSG